MLQQTRSSNLPTVAASFISEALSITINNYIAKKINYAYRFYY